MKKIFFIFALLSISLVSALAEESTERIYTDYTYDTTFITDNVIVTGTEADLYGLCLHNGNTITIETNNGAKITKVELIIGLGDYGLGEYNRLISVNYNEASLSYSTKDDTYCTINNVNTTSLVISSNVWCDPGDYNYLEICQIIVYYEFENVGNDGISDEYVLTESFANGDAYLGDYVKLEGNNGLNIGNGNTVTISPNNGKDVRIFEVDLEFRNEFNGTINSLDGSKVKGNGKNWTISNFYSPSLEISSPNSGQIDNITVHYVEMSEEKNVAINTKDGTKFTAANGRIIVNGTTSSGGFGLRIDQAYGDNNSVTIKSCNGVEISRVQLHFSEGEEGHNYYFNGNSSLETVGNVGDIEGGNENWTISNINSSSLTIYHTGVNEYSFVQIDKITVYYKEPIINSTMVVAANFADGAYWTTFFSYASNYQAPEGTQVFKVNLDGTKVTMIPIEDCIVNRCQGVVLKSTSANITMTKTNEESSDTYAGNSLWGTSSEITNPSPGNVYGLSYKSSAGVAFYKLKSTGTIGANKAYLKVNSNASAHEFFTFDIDETATGVDSINAQENEENVDVKIYDLQGRRVANPGKGIYIVNGKKVLMK